MNYNGHDEEVTVETGLFCLQPLLIIIELAPMLVTQQFSKIKSSTLAAVTWISDVLDQPGHHYHLGCCLTISEHTASFSDMLH
jgi:hypothetical protein